jgi:putative transposase
MPNHWHLVLRPAKDGELAAFMQWLTLTHTRRWQEHRHCHGSGHVYQGRFKSFPVQTDRHFLTVCRYVERNALRAGLVERAEEWRWSSLWIRREGDEPQRARLGAWPVEGGVPRQWLRTVNTPLAAAELDALRMSVGRGRPLGSATWTQRTADRLNLGHTLRPRGRPRKAGP